jgi:tetratricopeptide (TPR) repeat protein
MVQRLSAIRESEEVTRQQEIAAKEKLDQGIALYKGQKFAEALPLLQEAATLNPSNELATSYVRLAQLELQRLDAERAARQQKKTPGTKPAAVAGAANAPSAATAAAPAQLTTVFASPFSDGYIMVRAGGDLVAHENLWEEKGRAIFRRRSPRTVNVTRPVAPANTDVQVWVVVPSQRIQEHRAIRHNFAPGSSQRLQVTYNASSRSFDYQMN